MHNSDRFAKRLMAAALSAASTITPFATQAALPNGVAAGDTTATSAVLWARSTVKGPLSFEISESADFSGSRSILSGVTDVLVPAKAGVTELKPATRYYYRATDFSGKTASGEFRTAAETASSQGLRFGVSGDIRPELRPFPGIRMKNPAHLDFFVCLGDCVYAENYSESGVPTAQSLDEYRALYRQTLTAVGGMNTLRTLRGATTTYAMIDDHEVINDFAGAAPPASDPRFDANGAYINETLRYGYGLQAFQENMPLADEQYDETGDPREAGKRKLYRSRSFGTDAMFALVDARSFRDQGLPAANLADTASVGAFLAASFDPNRTMLGARQLADLKADLQKAQDSGVKWKFVMLPEPIQNLGILGASDRYEGYAAERTDLLKFIHDLGIHNVVFVTADIHGTLVNNLTYEEVPFGPKTKTDAFEISTGPIAFDQPFGPTVVELAAGVGLLTPEQQAFYAGLPVANDRDSLVNDKDDFIKGLLDGQLVLMGYDAVGLQDSPVQARLLSGDYLATHSYGWTRFDIDAVSKKLTVTTYGIPAYSLADIQANLADIVKRNPVIVSRFVVTPKS